MHWLFISQNLYENQIFLSGKEKTFFIQSIFWVMLDGGEVTKNCENAESVQHGSGLPYLFELPEGFLYNKKLIIRFVARYTR